MSATICLKAFSNLMLCSQDEYNYGEVTCMKAVKNVFMIILITAFALTPAGCGVSNTVSNFIVSDRQYAQKADLEETALESEMVCDCLNSIPEHYRVTLILKYVDGKSVKQIAELTNKSPKAIESLLQRSRNAFIKEYRLYQEKEGLSHEKK